LPPSNRKAQERLTDTARGIQHCQASFGQNRIKQHFSRWHIDGEKIIESDGLKCGNGSLNTGTSRAIGSCRQEALQDIGNVIEQHGFA